MAEARHDRLSKPGRKAEFCLGHAQGIQRCIGGTRRKLEPLSGRNWRKSQEPLQSARSRADKVHGQCPYLKDQTIVTSNDAAIDRLQQHVLDAMPLMVFVVDEDVQILYANPAAQDVLANDLRAIYKKRGGEVLRCQHATETPGGCGRAAACRECVVRNSVGQSSRGRKVFRSRARMTLLVSGNTKEAHLLVTAVPLEADGRRFTLLTLEDISEIMNLKTLIPVCAHCKRVRDDREYWQQVDEFLHRHLDLDISHGICPDCVREFYPKHIADRVLAAAQAPARAPA